MYTHMYGCVCYAQAILTKTPWANSRSAMHTDSTGHAHSISATVSFATLTELVTIAISLSPNKRSLEMKFSNVLYVKAYVYVYVYVIVKLPN